MRHFVTQASALLCLLFSCSASADELGYHVDLGLGATFVSEGDYDAAPTFDHAFAISQAGFIYRIGGFFIDELQLEDSDEDSELEIRALYIGLSRELDLDAVKIELGGGVVFSETEVIFLGRELTDENDESPYLNVKAVIPLNKLIALQADWKYVDDLSGGDLHLVEAGVRFSF